MDRQSPLVGLQLRQSLVATPPQPPPSASDGSHYPQDGSASPSSPLHYDPNIMHRAVPPTLFSCHVLCDASVVDLAASFSLPVSFVAANWITSRTPLIGSEPIPSGSPRQSCSSPSPSPADRAAYRNLADSLRSKLSAYSKDAPPVVDPCAHALALAHISQCGFDARSTHAQLKVRRETVRKETGGLYRTSHTLGGVCSDDSTYAEFVVDAGVAGAGLSVGVATRSVPLHALVGSEPGSIGYHASGRLVAEGEWYPFGASYGPGDCVSVRVSRTCAVSSVVSSEAGLSEPGSFRSSQHSPQGFGGDAGGGQCWVVSFFLNGRLQGSRLLGMGASATCRMAVSLYSMDSAVSVRCCVKEWEFFAAARDGGCRLRGICGVGRAGRARSDRAVEIEQGRFGVGDIGRGDKGVHVRAGAARGDSPVSGGEVKTPNGYQNGWSG